MKNEGSIHLQEMNYLEFLLSYLEGRVTLPEVLALNEQVYKKPVETRTKSLIAATTTMHKLNERLDRGEHVDKDSITNTITGIMLKLTSSHAH
ncbi:MAG: hypothetical protein ACREHC_08245 [Candidatus Levyibacteriota bacterium]